MSKATQGAFYSIIALSILACYVAAQSQITPVEVNQPHPPQPLPSNSPQAQPSPAQAAPEPASYCNVTTTKPTPATVKYPVENCIVAQFASYLSLGQGKYIDLGKTSVNINDSHCEKQNTTQEPLLVIDFSCGSLSLAIGHTNDSKTYVKNISGFYNLKEKPSNTFSNSSGLFYTTQSGHYYRCNTEQAILVGNELNLMMSNVALEAYRSSKDQEFYQIPEECALDSQPVSDLVRIGVGVCLVALVAIVLVAYFVGRRRWSERSTYESV